MAAYTSSKLCKTIHCCALLLLTGDSHIVANSEVGLVGQSFDRDSDDATENTTIISDASQTQKKKSSTTCLRWMNISTIASVKDGITTKVAPPFLTNCNNWTDIMLVCQLLVD